MIDYSASGLQQKLTFELLNRQRQSINALDGVQGFTRERNIHTTPRVGGSLDISLKQPIDLLKIAIRPWITVSYNGEEEHYPLMTGIPLVTGESRMATGAKLSLKLVDYTTPLDVPLGRHYTVPPGTIVTERVRAILLERGVLAPNIKESAASINAGMFWSATETWRKVINELLKSIGYSAIWADDWGQLQVQPYVRPADRPVDPDLGFIHGETCTYRPEFTIEHDVSGAINHTLITTRMPWEHVEPVIGEAWLPASHPYSYQSRDGLEVPYTEADVDLGIEVTPSSDWEDPTSATIAGYKALIQPYADAYAERLLIERSNPTRTFLVTNRWRPYYLHQVTRLFAPDRGLATAVDTRVSIIKDSLTYQSGGTVKMATTLQEVLSG